MVNESAGSLGWKTAGQSSRTKHPKGEDGLDEGDLERERRSKRHGNLQALSCQELSTRSGE